MKPRLRVLLVEDDVADATLLQRELGRGGFDLTVERVETAAAMGEALDRTTWDVVVSDYGLPTFSAVGALDIVKARDLDIPFIIVSGTIDDESAVAALKAGAHDFMTKNKLARLLPAIERELREASVRRAHRNAEVALRESDERYRIVAESASDAILIIDEDGTIAYVNPTTQQIFGFAPAQLIGQPLTTLVRERLKSRDRGSLAKELRRHRGDGPAGRVELIGFHCTGAVLWLDASIGGAIQGGKHVSICILHDVSARRKAELHRTRLYAAAKRARRAAETMCLEADRANKAKSDFLAMMSHELRTPLTAILGYTELLIDHQTDRPTSLQRAHLERVVVNSNRLVELINEVLTFSAVETGNTNYNITEVPLASLVVAVADAVLPSARKQGLTITLPPHDPRLSVFADLGKLQQVLSNILANAVKFTGANGQIDVSCDERPDDVRIRIRDTGCGIPAHELEKIFDPFVQLDSGLTRRHGGVGLGLAISREFARGMGGLLEVESTVGVGTVFTVTLPRADERQTVRLHADMTTTTAISTPARAQI